MLSVVTEPRRRHPGVIISDQPHFGKSQCPQTEHKAGRHQSKLGNPVAHVQSPFCCFLAG